MKKLWIIILIVIELYSLDIYTASSNGDYFSLVLKAQNRCNFKLSPIETRGSLDNIKRLISSEKPSYAIVQGDVLEFFKKLSDIKSRKKIRFIKKLENYAEAIYAIKNKKDRLFKDITLLDENYKKLKIIKDISVGTFGSGSSITGYNILTSLELNPYIRYTAKDDALDALLNKDIFLIIYVAKFDKKNNNIASWIDNILQKYKNYLELIEINPKNLSFYKEKVKYGKNTLILIPTFFISTDSNITKNMEIYKCLNY